MLYWYGLHVRSYKNIARFSPGLIFWNEPIKYFNLSLRYRDFVLEIQ